MTPPPLRFLKFKPFGEGLKMEISHLNDLYFLYLEFLGATISHYSVIFFAVPLLLTHI